MPEREPTQRADKGLEIPAPTRGELDDTPSKIIKPVHDGPQEVEDAAEQEAEYPADETDEG